MTVIQLELNPEPLSSPQNMDPEDDFRDITFIVQIRRFKDERLTDQLLDRY
jgi:hypothetical protein